MTDEDEAENQLESDLMESMLAPDLVRVKDEPYFENDTASLSSEPFSDIFLTERYQPVEEPWLLQSSIFSSVSEDMIESDVSEINDTVQDDEKTNLEDIGNLSQENSLTLQDSISTMILISSSICTMQRIAVLENGQLVELLLEPVKTKVQCDSVYVGVVTKLVPHMGGAFVNIGSSRPSLMDIKHNRAPFIFPPFRPGATKTEVDGALNEAIEEHLAALGINHASLELDINEMSEVVSQDDSVQSLHDDDEANDNEEDLDVSEIFTRNVNGNAIGHGQVNASSYSQIPALQDLRDSRHGANGKNKWAPVQKGTKIIVQVVKEGLGTKGPTLTAYPKLRSRFWVRSISYYVVVLFSLHKCLNPLSCFWNVL